MPCCLACRSVLTAEVEIPQQGHPGSMADDFRVDVQAEREKRGGGERSLG